MAVLRIQFNEYFTSASSLLTWFGETCSSETCTSYLHWCFHFLGEVTGSQIEPFAQIQSHFPVPWFCGLRNDTQLSWTYYAISGMSPWPQPLMWHTQAARDWCHKASLCHHLREALGDCPFGSVFWENDFLPEAARADISIQQEPSTGVLWGAVDRSLSGWAELRCLQLLHGPELLLAKTGTATKRGQSTKPTKSFGLACAGTCMTLEAVEQEGAVDDTRLFNWTLTVWKDPLWKSPSGPNVSSLGPFNCKSYLWTVFPLRAEQKSFHPLCFLPSFFLFLFKLIF